MKRIFLITCLSLLFFYGCSCQPNGGRSGATKIGVDPNWYPLDFGAQNGYINGFSEELLLDIAQLAKIEFDRISASWDNLFEGMKQGRYQGVLSSLPPYEFNAALYDFSNPFLELGPVLVVPEEARHTSLETMNSEHIGVINGDPAILILQKYEGLIIRNYPTIPDLLQAVAGGEIEGALLDRVAAGSYVNDLFVGKLKIAEAPLSNLGLRLIVLKGKQPHLIAQFNKAIHLLKKKKRMQALLKKWKLGETT